MKSSSRWYSAPLVASFEVEGEPYSVGLSVLDYHGNNEECVRLIVSDLVITINGEIVDCVQSDEEISIPFAKFAGGSTAEYFVEIPNGLIDSSVSTADLTANIKIHTNDGYWDESLSVTLERSGWKGAWLIWEAIPFLRSAR